jgi:hypothetical protein
VAMSQHKGSSLSLNGLTTLSEEAAVALSQHKGSSLSLNGLTTLSEEAAVALSQHKGRSLSLNGLTTLSDEAAVAIGQHKGSLSLDGLTRLSKAAVMGLAEHKSWLSLKGLTTLSAEMAQDLAGIEKWDGNLPNVTTIDSPDALAVAQGLANRTGPLRLPNLKKISPKTLTALSEKQDIVIPLFETLELIQEPDGSPTEDFIIPDWLEDRQKQQRGAQSAR